LVQGLATNRTKKNQERWRKLNSSRKIKKFRKAVERAL